MPEEVREPAVNAPVNDPAPRTVEDPMEPVNRAISVCRDAEQGFHGAANAVEDPELKRLFEGYSTQRAGFATELLTAMQAAGLNPAHPSGIAGALHRGWIELKGAITGHSPRQILEETERGEGTSLDVYCEALKAPAPESVRAILRKQFEEIQHARQQLRTVLDNPCHDVTGGTVLGREPVSR